MTFTGGSEAQAGMQTGTAAKVEKRIQEWIAEGFTPMAQYFAARNGVVFLHGAQGKSSPDIDDAPLTTESIFPISSITKTFTGALVMMLAEEGLLAPTDFVYRHIPQLKDHGKSRLTIAHLLTHTSGIDDDALWNSTDEQLAAVKLPDEYMHTKNEQLYRYIYLCSEQENRCPPGTEMSYCGFGIELVGLIIEQVTGKTLQTMMKERIFEPLNMHNTYLGVPEDVYPKVVNYPENAYFNIGVKSRQSMSAGSGAYSTAHDLSIFGHMLLNKGTYGGKRLLSRLSVEAMTRNQIPGISAIHDGVRFREAGWGFSLMLSLDKYDETGTLRSPETYGHSGAGCSMFIVDPVNNVVATFFDCTMKNPEDDFFERRFDRFYNMILSGVL